MKAAILSIALAAGLVAAQSNSVPSCAAPCLNEYTSGNDIAGCKNGAVKCICENTEFLDNIACCLERECTDEGKAAAVQFAQQLCKTAGVTVPDEVVCKNPSSSSAPASTESGSETSSAAAAEETETETAAESDSDSDSETTATDAAGSAASATDAAVTSTTSPGAAAELSNAGGLLGAVAAMLLAL